MTHSCYGNPSDISEDLLRLHHAVEMGDVGDVFTILESDEGSLINTNDANGLTPLMIAALYGTSLEIVMMLCEHGAKPLVSTAYWETALQYTLEGSVHNVENNLSPLVDKEAFRVEAPFDESAHFMMWEFWNDLNSCDTVDSHANFLHNALETNDASVIMTLLSRDGLASTINTPNSNGMTPLMAAVVLRTSLEIVMMLCEHGADTLIINEHGQTALHLAIDGASHEIVEYLSSIAYECLIEHGVKVDDF